MRYAPMFIDPIHHLSLECDDDSVTNVVHVDFLNESPTLPNALVVMVSQDRQPWWERLDASLSDVNEVDAASMVDMTSGQISR